MSDEISTKETPPDRALDGSGVIFVWTCEDAERALGRPVTKDEFPRLQGEVRAALSTRAVSAVLVHKASEIRAGAHRG